MYERSLLRTKILAVAAQLKNDHVYTKEQAIEDLLEIAKMLEDKKQALLELVFYKEFSCLTFVSMYFTLTTSLFCL